MLTEQIAKLGCTFCPVWAPSGAPIIAGPGMNICSSCVDCVEDVDLLAKSSHGICSFCGGGITANRKVMRGTEWSFCADCVSLFRAMVGKVKEHPLVPKCSFCAQSAGRRLFRGIEPGVAVCNECIALCKSSKTEAEIGRDIICATCGKDRRAGKIYAHGHLRICEKCMDTRTSQGDQAKQQPLMGSLRPDKVKPASPPPPIPSAKQHPLEHENGVLQTLLVVLNKMNVIEKRLKNIEQTLGTLEDASDPPERVASLNKVMPDPEDLENISKLIGLEHGAKRILSREASYELTRLLHDLDSRKGILGSLIVGHDGLLIANTMPNDLDPESIGVWALGINMNTENVLRRMGHDRVYQIVARTMRGHVVIADFGGGLLVTIGDGSDSPIYRKQATGHRSPSPPPTPTSSVRTSSSTPGSSASHPDEESYSYAMWIKKNRDRINAAIYKLQQSQTDE